jgi:hypothetical protein
MTPPDSQEVAARALVLRTVAVHALATPPSHVLEPIMSGWSWLDRQKFRWESRRLARQHWNPMKQAGLWDRLSPRELALAETTAVTMDQMQHVNASWRIEALLVLLWALRHVDSLPSYDTQVDHEILKTFAPASLRVYVETAQLRPALEIETKRDEAELWHWRSRTRELHERGTAADLSPDIRAPGIETFDDIARMTARAIAEKGEGPEIVDEDLAVSGKAYRDLTPEAWATVRSITVERHFALNWLCGHAPDNDWDETPTDT